MAIYKAPVSAASDAHGASLHNNQNNMIRVSISQNIYKGVEIHIIHKHITIQVFKQMLPSTNKSSSFS